MSCKVALSRLVCAHMYACMYAHMSVYLFYSAIATISERLKAGLRNLMIIVYSGCIIHRISRWANNLWKRSACVSPWSVFISRITDQGNKFLLVNKSADRDQLNCETMVVHFLFFVAKISWRFLTKYEEHCNLMYVSRIYSRDEERAVKCIKSFPFFSRGAKSTLTILFSVFDHQLELRTRLSNKPIHLWNFRALTIHDPPNK